MTEDDSNGFEIFDYSHEVFGSDFSDFKTAMEFWGGLNDRQHVWTEIEKVVDKVKELRGEPINFRVPSSFPYVAIRFSGDSSIFGVFISVGHVDHYVELPNSYPHPKNPKYWRTDLSTAGSEKSKNVEGSVASVVCPSCFLRVPLSGECGCGWRPTES